MVFRDHSNTAAEITLGEAYEIKGLLYFTSSREGGIALPEGHAKSFPKCL